MKGFQIGHEAMNPSNYERALSYRFLGQQNKVIKKSNIYIQLFVSLDKKIQ